MYQFYLFQKFVEFERAEQVKDVGVCVCVCVCVCMGGREGMCMGAGGRRRESVNMCAYVCIVTLCVTSSPIVCVVMS